MKRQFLYFTIISLLVLLIFTVQLQAQDDGFFTEEDQYDNLRMGNDYVVIVVNQSDNGRGRFAIETTGGAPLKDSDKDKPLVYGRPVPWTSYTSLRIDNQNYVFGGETERRAGKTAEYGEIIKPPEVSDNEIVTVSEIDDIEVEQKLKIVKSTTTGLYDSVQIRYEITNQSDEEKEVGLRLMLDTMLGENDGAPFRVGEEAVTTDKMYRKDDLPEFWQAFDSISSPKITSQGTFKGPGISPPDKVYFADWGSMADGTWDFDFNPGEEFIRKGEYETDSAMAMYWNSKEIEAGETKTYVTNYGLGGITTVPGLLSLGVTSPAEVTLDEETETFPVVAYLENTSEITAESVNLSIDLPEGFEVEEKVQELGDLDSGDTRQVTWDVAIKGEDIPDEINYNVSAEADNTDKNEVNRRVKFIAPPKLESDVNIMDDLEVRLGRIYPNPFTIKANVKNSGGSVLYNASSELILPPGITLAAGETNKKYLSFIKPDQEVEINWKVKSLNVAGGFQYAVKTEGMQGYSQTEKNEIELPEVNPLLYMYVDEEYEKGDLVTVEVRGENIEEIERLDLDLTYNEENIKPVYVYPGTIFVEDEEVHGWNGAEWDDERIRIRQNLPPDTKRGIIAYFQFRVLNDEKLSLQWHQNFAHDEEGKDIEIETHEEVIEDE